MSPGIQPPSSGRVCFGPFEFDASAQELRKNGIRLRLRGQPLETLAMLLERPGGIVTREQLQGRLWGQTFVDFEHGLNAAVNKLRQALSDDTDRPRYVETVPGVGYRFIAVVTATQPQPLPETRVADTPTRVETKVASAESPRHSIGRWPVLAFGSILLLAGLFWSQRTPARVPADTVRFQIPIPPGLEFGGSFSISPDGRTVVFRARSADGKYRLWAQSLDKLAARQLPGTELDSGLHAEVFWSPDSKVMVYHSNERLLKVDLQGNPPQQLCHVASVVLGGDWNQDGVIIFGTETQGIMRVSSEGGVPVSITSRDGSRNERVHGWPAFLPDGRHFIYTRISSVPANSGVFVSELDKPTSAPEKGLLVSTAIAGHLVPGQDSQTASLLFQRERTLWTQDLSVQTLKMLGEPRRVEEGVGSFRAMGFFSASRNGHLVFRSAPPNVDQLAWRDLSGNRIKKLNEPAHFEPAAPILSPDGSRFVTSRFDNGSIDIWVSDLNREVAQRITSQQNISPIWMPDGESIVYASGTSGHYDLLQAPATGGAERVLYASPETKYPTSITPDGRYLLFSARDQKANSDVWYLDVKTPQARAVRLLASEADERSAQISPDGKWLAFVATQSGRPEVYVQKFDPAQPPGGSKIQVSREGGDNPRWKKDSQMLFYAAPDRTLVAVNLVQQGRIAPGIPKSLFVLPSDRWDIAPDGSRVLVGEPVPQPVPPFTAVLNWQSSAPSVP